MTRVGLLFNEPLPEGAPNWESSADVLIQVAAIETALAALGHAAVRLPFTRDLSANLVRINAGMSNLIVNLCESVDEDPLLSGHPAAVLELLGLPFTGSSAIALLLSTDKVTSKQLLRGAALPTPGFFLYSGGEVIIPAELHFPVILKPRYQDASIGIDQESVLSDKSALTFTLPRFYAQYGPIMVEEFVCGREFNIALIGNAPTRVLPIAEIDFVGMPDHLHRIVGYRAKWEESSVEYRHTNRVFPTDLATPLTKHLQQLAVETFNLFGLRDYGRVDMRLDANNEPYVLEVNANPCLSPDAGFAVAAKRGGLDYSTMVGELLKLVCQRIPQ